MSSIRRNWIFYLMTLFLLALCCAAVVYSQEKPEYGPQVVFVVTQNLKDGAMRIVPKTQVIFRVIPMMETHPAPLPDGTNMICRTHDVHATNGIFLGLKCGADEYIVQAVGINPEK